MGHGHRKMRQQRTVPFKSQLLIGTVVLILMAFNMIGCATTEQKHPGYQLPPVVREVFRGGQIKGMEQSNALDGMPDPYDLVDHTCLSTPIFDLEGQYVRTVVRCW